MSDRGTAVGGMAWDLVATVGVYYGLRAAGVPERPALVVATVLAAARLVWVALRRREVTWFAVVMMSVFGLGLLLTLLGGDARVLLVQDSATTAAVGAVFLLSAAAGRPLTLSAAQASQPWRAGELEEMFRGRADVRRRLQVGAVVWGIGLLVESVARIPLVLALPVDTAVGVTAGLMWGTIAVLAAWNLCYSRVLWQGTQPSEREPPEQGARSAGQRGEVDRLVHDDPQTGEELVGFAPGEGPGGDAVPELLGQRASEAGAPTVTRINTPHGPE